MEENFIPISNNYSCFFPTTKSLLFSSTQERTLSSCLVTFSWKWQIAFIVPADSKQEPKHNKNMENAIIENLGKEKKLDSIFFQKFGSEKERVSSLFQ